MILPRPDASSKTSRWLLAIVAAFALLYVIYLLRIVLIPFAVAGALAYVASPSINWLQRRFKLPRGLAAMGPFLIVLAFLALVGCVGKVYLAPQINNMLADKSILERFLGTLFRGHTFEIGGKPYNAHSLSELLLTSAKSNFDPRAALSDIGVVIGLVMGIILTIVLLLYFLIDGPRIARGVVWLAPPAIREQVITVGRRSGPVIRGYVRGILVITTYAIAFSFVMTRFVLHLDNALVLSIAVGLLEVVPVIGPVIAVVLLGLVAISQMTFWKIVGVAVFTTLLRVTIDQFVGPIVLGRSVKLPAPMIIFAFMAGGAIWGVLGVMVAIPAAAILKIVLETAYGETPSESAFPDAETLPRG